MVKNNLSSERRANEVLARIGARLRQAREAAGLSQRELAGRVGGQAQRIECYELGRARLTARCLFTLAGALGRPVTWFFEGLPEAAVGLSDAAAPALARPSRSNETHALIEAFHSIADPETRRDIIRLLRGIAAEARSRR
jgi:transcriptional regulator with XRE-family HTH domain